MTEQVRDVLFAVLRAYVTKTSELTDEQKNTAKASMAPLYKLSAQHDLAHVMGYALFEEGLTDGEAYALFEKQHMMSVFRYEGFAYEQERLSAALEKAGIPHILLKGAVLRQHYPEPWMRTSCDVDVLVHPERLAEAEAVLLGETGYQKIGEGPHDVTLLTEGGVHIELHFALTNRKGDKVSLLLQKVWEYASPKSGTAYTYELSDEMFYFYHIAHMARHFAAGGCGIRTFLDLWFLENLPHDEAARNALLKKGDLLTFADAARRLCRAWFSVGEKDDLLEEMERFVAFGGVYGSKHNYIVIRQKQKGGKVRYVLSRLFIPYGEMKYIYPILKKWAVLLPLFWVWRWIEHLARGGAKRSLGELETNRNLSVTEREAVAYMLQTLGL